MSVVDASKARLFVEGWGDAEVLGAFIDPRNGRWAYRIMRVCPEDAPACDGGQAPRSRIIYPDQIERLEWTVRGEVELKTAASPAVARDDAGPPLLGGGGALVPPSLGARILLSAGSPSLATGRWRRTSHHRT